MPERPMGMTDDEYNWLINAADQNMALIDDSSVFLSLFSKDMTKDVIPCLQLGIAMMLDKPILVVAKTGDTIPDNLQKVATAIYQGELDTPEFKRFMMEHCQL